MENMGGEADEVVATEVVFVSPEDDAMKSVQGRPWHKNTKTRESKMQIIARWES